MGDNIVFPGGSQGPGQVPAPTLPAEGQVETQGLSLTLVLLLLLLCLLLLLLLLLSWWWLRSRRRRREEKGGVLESVPGQMSGTLGSTYGHSLPPLPESHSLLSSRKSSAVTDILGEGKEVREAWDTRVSRYIDASTAELVPGGGEDLEQTYYTSLREGREETYMDEVDSSMSSAQPPLAPQEDFPSRPGSTVSSFSMAEILSQTQSISIIGDGGEEGAGGQSRPISTICEGSVWVAPGQEPPTLLVSSPTPTPTSPGQPRDRPHSALVEPPLPPKQRLQGASSEVHMHSLGLTPHHPSAARSDSHLSIVPSLPPKTRPFLPPKQAIGRSKEDLERINRDILRASSHPAPPVISEEVCTDQDYDFPACDESDGEDYDLPQPVLPHGPPALALRPPGSTDSAKVPGHLEDEDYDLPQPVLPQNPPPSVHSPALPPGHPEDQDYDEPVLSHRTR